MNTLQQYFFWPLLILLLISCEETDSIDIVEDYSQYGTPFSDMPAIRDVIMYEVNLRALSSTGDILGVIDRLDEIQKLGTNAIWLMPIHPIGEINSVNSPYSVKDYKAVSEEYGTLEDLRTLTDSAHTLGMAVILDWVANHTAWDNPWIENRSWYSWDDNFQIIHPPGTNWLDVADLNYFSQDMRAAMIDAMRYWVLEANIDGYRCDYADGVPFDFWESALSELTDIPDRELIFLAEGRRLDHYSAGFDLTYGWDFYGTLKAVFDGESASTLFSTHMQEYQGVPSGSHRLRFTTNHDESAWDATPMVLFDGVEGALAASVATIFLGGVPLIYTGQEVGRTATVPFFSNSAIDWQAHPEMLSAYRDLLQLYKMHPTARYGELVPYIHDDVVCFLRQRGSDELLFIVNLRNSAISYPVPADLQNISWTNAMADNLEVLETVLDLEPYDFLILQR